MDIFHLFTILTILFFSFPSLGIGRNIHFQQEEEGFTLDLIHRDSPISPLYDPSRTHFDRIADAFNRSKSRVSSIMKTIMKTSSSNDIQFQLNRVPGEYIMELSIGTPPYKIQGIIDTMSDFTWTPCDSCTTTCNQTNPVFNPLNSKSYKILSCNSSSSTNQCLDFNSAITGCAGDNTCGFKTNFFSIETESEGELSSETFTFYSSSADKASLSIKNIVFGCGESYLGGFINGTMYGTFSLSSGPMSIVNQLKQRKFSYCLVPSFNIKSNVTSKINFGSHAIVAGPGTVTTPLRKNSSHWVSLEAIKVDNKIISYKPFAKKWNISIEQGNAIIDSGLTMTYLPCEIYHNYLKKEVKAAIEVKPSDESCGLCYKNTPDLKLPTITLSFTGGDVVLPPSSTFVEAESGYVCLAFSSLDDDDTELEYIVIGNLVQQNFLVGYDLVKHQVSFKPTDCTKQ